MLLLSQRRVDRDILVILRKLIRLGMSVHTSGRGDQRRTSGSMPLVASKQYEGCGCRQFTMELSPRRIRTLLVVLRSQK